MDVNESPLRPISTEKKAATTDTRKLALDCMVEALAHLDEDPNISPVIGSHLQLAIDRLASSMKK